MLQIDWLQYAVAGLSALGGFALGAIAEPLKKIINDALKRRDLRRALYAEIAFNYVSIEPLLFCGPPEYLHLLMQKFDENIKRVARLETFEHVKSQNELAFKIGEWNQLIHLYSFLSDIVNSPRLSEFKARQGVTWLAIVEACALDPLASGMTSLDIEMFSKINRGAYQLLLDIKSGKRQRAHDRLKDVEQKMGEPALSLNRSAVI